MSAPIPPTPRAINSTSMNAQIDTTILTWRRFNPCRNTNAFCAPIATIRLAPNPAPDK
jgi:hypothetical protein